MLNQVPLSILRAFEAAGRTGSFTAAASETGLTQSAISQRISHLENRLGTRLFTRGARGVALTVDGEAWLPYVTGAIQTLQQSSEDLFGRGRRHLTISASASVQELWLAPRLGAVDAAEQLNLTFKTMVLADDAGEGVSIRNGTGSWPTPQKVPLFAEAISPVAAPGLLQQGARWQDLPRLALSGPRPGWSEWMAATGDSTVPVPTLRLDGFAAALAATRAGAGVLLASLPLAGADLRSGALVRLSDEVLSPRETYWLIGPERQLSPRLWAQLVRLFAEAPGTPG